MLDATPSFIFGEAFLAEARRRRVGRGSEHPVKSTILAASLRGASVVVVKSREVVYDDHQLQPLSHIVSR
jgi:hypothetical protein